MPKPSKKDLLEAMNDPELLKSAGLQPISDAEEKELFSPLSVGADDTMEDLVRKINDRTLKQKDYFRNFEDRILNAAKDTASQGEVERRKKEVDSFLKDHPELGTNSALLDIVDPLYANGKDLKDAWEIACKSMGFDPSTGKAPSEDKKDEEEKPGKKKEEEKKERKTPLRSDTIDTGLPGERKEGDEERPKTVREIAGELSNDLAAKGKNPFRDS